MRFLYMQLNIGYKKRRFKSYIDKVTTIFNQNGMRYSASELPEGSLDPINNHCWVETQLINIYICSSYK